MSRPATTPRLPTIEPAAFADEVRKIVVARVGALVVSANGPEAWRGKSVDGTRVRDRAAILAMFAKTGAMNNHERAEQLLLALEDALYRRPIDGEDPLPDVEEQLDLETPIGVVLAAAHARVLLADKRPVPLKCLAALGGCNRVRLTQLIHEGVLKRSTREPDRGQKRAAPILASSAIEWLRGQGVPGFERTP
jgi:hypothetical protein